MRMRPVRPQGAASAPLGNINADTIRRAEEAVSRLSDQYRDWVRGDIVKLRDCLARAKAGPDERRDAYKLVRQVAHDLRGQGTTFGFPLITRIAQSVSQAVKEHPDGEDADAALDAHVDALDAVIESDVADASGDKAAHIIETLEAAIGRPVA